MDVCDMEKPPVEFATSWSVERGRGPQSDDRPARVRRSLSTALTTGLQFGARVGYLEGLLRGRRPRGRCEGEEDDGRDPEVSHVDGGERAGRDELRRGWTGQGDGSGKSSCGQTWSTENPAGGGAGYSRSNARSSLCKRCSSHFGYRCYRRPSAASADQISEVARRAHVAASRLLQRPRTRTWIRSVSTPSCRSHSPSPLGLSVITHAPYGDIDGPYE